MLKFIAAAGLGALIAISSLAASAQTTAPPGAHPHQVAPVDRLAQERNAQAAQYGPERARASAEHMRQMRNQ